MSIEFNNHLHGFAIAAAAGTSFDPKNCAVISRTDGHRLLGGFVYEGYNKKSIGAHTASFSPHWLNRDMLWVAFDYPFNLLKCTYVTLQIPSDNMKSLAFAGKLGFREVVRLPDHFPQADLLVLRMHKDECKWLSLQPRSLSSKHGREE